MVDNISTQIPLDRLAPSGILGELLVLDIIKFDKRSDHDRLHDNSERSFNIKARLSKHPETNNDIDSSLDPERGSSYFLAHPEAAITKLYSPVGPFEIYHNERRELSIVSFSCKATSIEEARQKFVDGVMPFFDYMCFITDLPLFMPLILCEDGENRVRAFDYVSPYPDMIINPLAAC